MNNLFTRIDVLKKELNTIMTLGECTLNGKHDYLEAATNDFKKTIDYIVSISRIPNSIQTAPGKLNFTDDMEFNAFIDEDSTGVLRFNLPIGLLLAIDDLCARLVSNGDFFCFDFSNEGKRCWNGCDCAWMIPFGGIIPEHRFLNYSSIRNTPTALETKSTGTYLSNFYEVFPINSERENLFRLMVTIALSWVFLHEEGHIVGGHCHHQRENGLAGVSLGMAESSLNHEVNDLSFKAMEWEADRDATSGIVDIFYNKFYFDLLPSYAVHNEIWFQRIFLTTIGAVIQLIQKKRKINNVEGYYPSPRSRLISSTAHFINRLKKKAILSEIDTYNLLKGSYDDIYIISDLLSKTGLPLSSWNVSNPPVSTKEELQNLLDTPEEAELMASMFISSSSNDSAVQDIFRGGENKKYEHWFKENFEIASFHKNVFWRNMYKYRCEAGFPNI